MKPYVKTVTIMQPIKLTPELLFCQNFRRLLKVVAMFVAVDETEKFQRIKKNTKYYLFQRRYIYEI